MKIKLTESQLKRLLSESNLKKQLLKEDIMDCPTGFIYDKEVDNCVEVQELDELVVISFRIDVDGSISESYKKYLHRLKQLEELYKEEGGIRQISTAFYYKNLKKPMGGYNVEFFDKLYNIVNAAYVNRYKTFERYRRERFIEDEVRPLVGKPYVWGTMGPEFFDCSGLICHVFERGWKHNAQMLYDKSYLFKSINDVRVGDIVYFDYHMKNPEKDKSPEKMIEHVGIISSIDGGKIKMIHAGGDNDCTMEKYLAGKLPNRCRVKEVNYGPKWRKKTKAFGKLKDYNF